MKPNVLLFLVTAVAVAILSVQSLQVEKMREHTQNKDAELRAYKIASSLHMDIIKRIDTLGYLDNSTSRAIRKYIDNYTYTINPADTNYLDSLNDLINNDGD